MAIEKKLICFARLEEFERQLAAGNIKDYSIVLIQDAKKIYNRGTYYDCSGITQEQGDERYVRKITEDGMTVSGIDQIRNPSSGMTYAFSESGNGNENGIILTSDITKTINGTSLLGSGNIEIESSGEANVQSDWEQEDVGDDSYIKNRTHYCYASTYIGQFVTVSKEVGDVLFEGLSEGVQYTILNNRNTSKNYSFQFVTGRKINIPFNGPTVEAVCSEDGSLVLASSTYGIAESFSVHFAEVKQLDDIYIPETIARTSELKTINGESIVGSGDLTIEGGAKIYTWSPTITSIEDAPISGTFTEEEYYNILNADVLYIKVDGQSIFCIARGINSENGEGILITGSQITTYADFAIDISLIKEDGVFTGTMSEPIPSKTSQLENDSNFITSDGLKTINGQSILGSGNIEISGGESFWYEEDGTVTTDEPVALGDAYIRSLSTPENGYGNSTCGVSGQVLTTNGEQCYWADAPSGGGNGGGSSAYSEVNHGTSDTTFTLTPNTFHVWDEVASLTLTLGSETAGIANEFLFQFNSGSTATSLTLPDNIKWANDSAPTIAENMIYQISILNKIACVIGAKYVKEISFYVSGVEFYAEEGMTWAEWCLSKYNTKQFMNYGSYIFATYPYTGYIYESPNSQITPNTNYTITQGSGGGN